MKNYISIQEIDCTTIISYPQDYKFELISLKYLPIGKKAFEKLKEMRTDVDCWNKCLVVIVCHPTTDAFTALYQHDDSYYVVLITENN